MKAIWKRSGAVMGILLSVALGYMMGVSSAGAVQEKTVVRQTEPTDTIGEFRTERQQLRQMQLSQLNEMIHGENTGAEIIAMAQGRRMQIMEWAEQEQTLEGLLKLRNFEDALVTIHTDSVNVLLRAESLSQQQAALVLELVMRETGISGGNVKIIPIN